MAPRGGARLPRYGVHPARLRVTKDALLECVLEAHGGLDRWKNLSTLSARITYGGPFWRFEQLASWQALLELAAINAPHGFMIYSASVPQFAHCRPGLRADAPFGSRVRTQPPWLRRSRAHRRLGS